MESLRERARPVVRGLAIWVMLAGAAIAKMAALSNRRRQTATDLMSARRTPVQAAVVDTFRRSADSCGAPQVNFSAGAGRVAPACVGLRLLRPAAIRVVPAGRALLSCPPSRWYVVSELAAIRRNPNYNFDFCLAWHSADRHGGTYECGAFDRGLHLRFHRTGRLVVGHTFNECLQIEGVYFGCRRTTVRRRCATARRTLTAAWGISSHRSATSAALPFSA